MPVNLSAAASRLPASADVADSPFAVGKIPQTPATRASTPLPAEGDFVRALNVFGSLLLDVMPANPAEQDGAVFGAKEMALFKKGVKTFVRDQNTRATSGELNALELIARAFERSRGSDPSFGPAHWANFLDFVQSKMPPDVQGFSDLAKEVREANRSDGDSAVFSATDMNQLSRQFRQELAGAFRGSRLGADDWARFFLGLVINDGGESSPPPSVLTARSQRPSSMSPGISAPPAVLPPASHHASHAPWVVNSVLVAADDLRNC
jgi:hypothetical protein